MALTPAYRAGAIPSGEPVDILEDLTGPETLLRTVDFASDYDFHIAVVNDVFGPLQNRHNVYLPPSCCHNFTDLQLPVNQCPGCFQGKRLIISETES